MDRQLFIASRDSAEPLEPTETAFDDVPFLVAPFVEWLRGTRFITAVGDHWFDLQLVEQLANPFCRVTFIARHLLGHPLLIDQLLHQITNLLRLMFLTRANRHGKRHAFAVADNVEFRAESALAASQGVIFRLSFWKFFWDAPAAD